MLALLFASTYADSVGATCTRHPLLYNRQRPAQTVGMGRMSQRDPRAREGPPSLNSPSPIGSGENPVHFFSLPSQSRPADVRGSLRWITGRSRLTGALNSWTSCGVNFYLAPIRRMDAMHDGGVAILPWDELPAGV